MISICIPVFNNDVSGLVKDLCGQCEDSGAEYEIVLLDDASNNSEYIGKMQQCGELPNVSYHRNDSNLGLAQTRNRLGELARYPYLLFIDSDAKMMRADYIERYIKFCYKNVVCFGGCAYTKECSDEKYILRWKYGKMKEEGVGKYYSCFNFLVDKDILKNYPFASDFRQYGYEDTMFGINLEQNDIEVCFIDNPMLHMGLDPAEVYLDKVRQSLTNLLALDAYFHAKDIDPKIRSLKVFRFLRKFHLNGIVAATFRNIQKLFLKNLKGKKPSLTILNFYKLGYLCNLKHTQDKC